MQKETLVYSCMVWEETLQIIETIRAYWARVSGNKATWIIRNLASFSLLGTASVFNCCNNLLIVSSLRVQPLKVFIWEEHLPFSNQERVKVNIVCTKAMLLQSSQNKIIYFHKFQISLDKLKLYMVLFEQTGTSGISFTSERGAASTWNLTLLWIAFRTRRNKGEKLLSSNEQQVHDFLLGLAVSRPTNCKGLVLNDHGQEISSLLTGQPRIA